MNTNLPKKNGLPMFSLHEKKNVFVGFASFSATARSVTGARALHYDFAIGCFYIHRSCFPLSFSVAGSYTRQVSCLPERQF